MAAERVFLPIVFLYCPATKVGTTQKKKISAVNANLRQLGTPRPLADALDVVEGNVTDGPGPTGVQRRRAERKRLYIPCLLRWHLFSLSERATDRPTVEEHSCRFAATRCNATRISGAYSAKRETAVLATKTEKLAKKRRKRANGK